MDFWVYENWQAHGHRATVHRSECGHCNAGQGKTGGASSAHGRWHGPFATGEEAFSLAETKAREARRCRVCAP